jgi:aryl-alcohol dehydrogenase-like predicted oxidoreductase
MTTESTRREFIEKATFLGAALAAVRATGGLAAEPEVTQKAKEKAEPVAESKTKAEARATLPTIRLGTLEVSRLILGSNPFFGFAHKPGDVGRTMKEYYTDDRVMAILDAAADQGITAVWTPCYDAWIKLWNRYQEKGGKLRIWIGQPDHSPDEMKAAITACAKNGGKAVCIQGERIDAEMRAGRYEVVRGWLEHIRSFGLPAGMASHRPETHLIAESKKLPTDFYHQCLYQPEDYGDALREKALATVAKLAKPVVAYKVLAAGRLPAKEAFEHVLARLQPKDGLCVGVFPKDDPDQLEEDAALVSKLTKKGT